MKNTYFTLLCMFLIHLLPAQEEARLTEQDKLYGLAQLWKGVDKNFAFFDQVPELDWDSMYYANIPLVQATGNDYEYVRLLQRICHELQDGHTRVYLPQYLNQKRNRPAIYTDIIEGHVFVTDVINDTIAALGVAPKMEILKIDGVPVKEYAEANVKPYAFSSTAQDMDVRLYAYQLLEGWSDDPATLTLKTPVGEIIERDLPRNLQRNHPQSGIMSFEELENGMGVLTIRRFWGDDFQTVFDSIFPLLKDTKGLIVDVRKNDGGNSDNAVYVMSHLSSKSFYTSNWSTPVYNAAYDSWGRDQEWYGEPGELVEPDGSITPYQQPIAMLIGARTYSAGEDFCSYYQQADIGPMIGSLTAGSTGNPTGINLVKDVWAQVCTKRDVFYDGTEFVGIGVKPDVAVASTAEDYLNGKDTVLAAAIAYLLEKQ